MTKIKICGITNLEDALVSARSGAAMLGFNFCEKSPRFISPELAGEIGSQLPKDIEKVGVFVNESVQNVLATVEAAQLNGVQLHGDETKAFVDQLRSFRSITIIKAFRVTTEFGIEDALDSNADAILLDGYSPNQRGGTGETFDWAVASTVSRSVEYLFLAGGLVPGNVRDAIETVRPYAVDVCSGVESAKGKKDLRKVEEFIRNARSAI